MEQSDQPNKTNYRSTSMKNPKSKIKEKLGEKNTAKLKKALPTLRLIKNILCWALIVIIALSVIFFMITRMSGGTPSLFGYSLHRVMSGSMEPELEVNDVILNRDISDASEILVGDIVSYRGDESVGNVEITHRVITAPYDGAGGTVIITKGDANNTDDGEIGVDRVKSKVVKKLPFLKWIMNFFFSVWGLILFLALILLIFIDEFRNIIRTTVKNEDEDAESFREVMERFKQEEIEKAEQKKESHCSEKSKNNISDKAPDKKPKSEESTETNKKQKNRKGKPQKTPKKKSKKHKNQKRK